ncbi:MAG: Ca-activated chloride channel [Acidimicrobiaceae bacterium]|jgi:Ca-activated chloride channel family protein
MTLLSPGKLWLLVIVAALVVAYVALQRSRRRHAVRHPDIRLVAAVSSKRAGWRRHLVAGSLAVAITSLVIGLARPAQSVEVPRTEAVVMLAIDVSGSMTATDVAPTRMEAAITSAKAFVSNAPANFRIGLVAFDDSGHTLAPPTTNRTTVLDALGRLARGHGTAAGEGLFTALDDIKAATSDTVVASKAPYSAVILLADGANTIGRSLTDAAQAAKDQNVPVYTIAYGTPNGTAISDGKTVAVPADPAAMAEVAKTSGGTTFTATSGNELASVYNQIGARIGHTVEQQEVVVLFAVIAMAALVLALSGAMVWNPRLV